MKKLKLKFLYIFSIMFFCGTFFICNNVLASITIDDNNTSETNSIGPTFGNDTPTGLGQTFIPTQNNITRIDMRIVGSYEYTDFYLTICKGTPVRSGGRADVLTNAPNCSWSGNTTILSTTLLATSSSDYLYSLHYDDDVPTWGTDDNIRFDFPAIEVIPTEEYYFFFSYTSPSNHYWRYIDNVISPALIFDDNFQTHDLTFAEYYDTEYSASQDYYVSNDSETAGIERLASADATVYSVRIHSCKEEDNDDGQFGMAVWDNDADVYLATSTLSNMSDLTYQADLADCLMAHTYSFPLGFEIENGKVYQYQIYRTDNGVGYPTSETGTSYTSLLEESSQFIGEMDDTEDSAKLFEIETVPFFNYDIFEYADIEGTDYGEFKRFIFPPIVNCLIATSCPIQVFYPEEYIGNELYFLDENEDDWLEYTDAILPLLNKPYLEATIYPTIRSTETIDEYQYWIWDTASSTQSVLFGNTIVYWVDEITEELENQANVFDIFSKLKNLFPFSLVLQIKDVITDITKNADEVDYVSIGMSDLIADDYSSLIASTSVIMGHDILEDTLPVWNTKIFPFMETIVYLINFIFIIFLILPGRQSAGSEGV